MKARKTPALSRGRLWLVRAIIALAALVAVAAIFAVWANRQVLNADNWSQTSSELLENPQIRSQISAFLVDQVYDNIDVSAELAAALPPRLDPLAAPAANAVRGLAERRTNRLLGRPRVQEAWETANRVTAQQFIAIAEGNSRAISRSGDAVVLDLRVVVLDVLRRLGAPGKLAGKIPPDAGRIRIMSGDEVQSLQTGVSLLRGMSAVLPGLAVALLALAVFLSPGRRRRTLMSAGFAFIVAGALVLIARNLAGGYVVDSLASTASIVPAAEAAWSIGTEMLSDVAQAAIVMGIPVVIAAWIAGPARPAVALRRALAPWLRTRPVPAYATLAVLLLLVIWWEPIPATRMVLPVLLMIVLSFAGLEILRRQVAEEFPQVTADHVGHSLRASMQRAVRAVSTARHGNGAAAAAEPPAPAMPVAPVPRVDQLERLAALRDKGALSEEEFAAEKAQLETVANRS
jgi:hypothetical protein